MYKEYDETSSEDEEVFNEHAIEEVFDQVEHKPARIDLSLESRYQANPPPVDEAYLQGDPGTLLPTFPFLPSLFPRHAARTERQFARSDLHPQARLGL